MDGFLFTDYKTVFDETFGQSVEGIESIDVSNIDYTMKLFCRPGKNKTAVDVLQVVLKLML